MHGGSNKNKMKVLCWNINGIRASIRKGDLDFLLDSDWDVVCLQETKALESEVTLPEAIKAKYPHRFWRSTKGTTQRKGLSGTTIWSRVPVLGELEPPAWDEEGRITAVAFPFWNLVTVYTPNSQAPGAERNVHRIETWDPQFREYMRTLNAEKPTIVCGDFNVANEDIDVDKPDKWRNESAGFLDQERSGFKRLLATGLHDVFRERNPDLVGAYTYWDQKIAAFRKHNKGWRIDYFLVPPAYRRKVTDAGILRDVMGSDHCPITLEFEERRPLRLVESFE